MDQTYLYMVEQLKKRAHLPIKNLEPTMNMLNLAECSSLAKRAAIAALKRAKPPAPAPKITPKDRAGGPVFIVEHGQVALLTKNRWGRIAHAVYMPESDGLVEALITIDRHTQAASYARGLIAEHLKAAGAVSREVLSVDAVLESFRWMCAKDFDATLDALSDGASIEDLFQVWLEANRDASTPWDAKPPPHQLDWLGASWQKSLAVRSSKKL